MTIIRIIITPTIIKTIHIMLIHTISIPIQQLIHIQQIDIHQDRTKPILTQITSSVTRTTIVPQVVILMITLIITIQMIMLKIISTSIHMIKLKAIITHPIAKNVKRTIIIIRQVKRG